MSLGAAAEDEQIQMLEKGLAAAFVLFHQRRQLRVEITKLKTDMERLRKSHQLEIASLEKENQQLRAQVADTKREECHHAEGEIFAIGSLTSKLSPTKPSRAGTPPSSPVSTMSETLDRSDSEEETLRNFITKMQQSVHEPPSVLAKTQPQTQIVAEHISAPKTETSGNSEEEVSIEPVKAPSRKFPPPGLHYQRSLSYNQANTFREVAERIHQHLSRASRGFWHNVNDLQATFDDIPFGEFHRRRNRYAKHTSMETFLRDMDGMQFTRRGPTNDLHVRLYRPAPARFSSFDSVSVQSEIGTKDSVSQVPSAQRRPAQARFSSNSSFVHPLRRSGSNSRSAGVSSAEPVKRSAWVAKVSKDGVQ